MNRDRLVMVLAAVFGGLSVTLVITALAFEPLLLVIGVPFGIVAYFMWYQASGQLGRRLYRTVEEAGRRNNGADPGRGGFGAGPREEWSPRSEWARRGGFSNPQGRRRARDPRNRAPTSRDGPSRREAFRLLGVAPDADQGTIKRAYREKVKEVHPDTKTGDEETFKKVTAAYELLSE